MADSSALPEWKRKLPMQLTWARIALCPFMILVLVFMKSNVGNWLASALFIVASITDWLDGYYARKFKAITNMGKFMDPIADKILVASVLIMLVGQGRVPPLVVILLLSRDILIGGIRSVAAADNIVIDAKAAGKWKTAIQMIAVPAILIGRSLFGLPVSDVGLLLLWASVVLSLISGYQYIQIFRQNSRSLGD